MSPATGICSAGRFRKIKKGLPNGFLRVKIKPAGTRKSPTYTIKEMVKHPS